MDILGLIALARSKGGGSGSGTFVPSFGTLATIQTGVSWFGDDPYTLTVLVSGYTVTDKTMISVLPSVDVIEQMMADGVTNIFITNNNGVLTATAVGAAPTAAMTLHVLCTESDASATISSLPGIVGNGVLETLQATDLTDAINKLGTAINGKQDKPATAGTAGQVLALDDNLNPVWTNQSGGGGGDVTDVQIDGTSILSGGVANIPIATDSEFGTVKGWTRGVQLINGQLMISTSNDASYKSGTSTYSAVTIQNQHKSAFFGLAKAAGDTTQSASANAVGAYTEAAKSAIHEMLNGAVAVSGTTPTIVAKSGIRYVCGEVATLDFTPSATGICDVVFTSGATATVLTVPSTIKWANGFDPTSLEANTTYEINIMDGIGVAVGVSA